MRILQIGHKGALGSLVHEHLTVNSTVSIITASRSSGDFHVDIRDETSIRNLFEKVGMIDAIIVTSGETVFKPFSELTPDDNNQSIDSKLRGQVNVVLIGKDYINDNGSITLTTGIIGDEFIPMGTSSSMVNGALRGFVESAATELSRGIRINTVSPGPLRSTWNGYQSYFIGFSPVADNDVANAYIKSVYGIMTGKVFKIY